MIYKIAAAGGKVRRLGGGGGGNKVQPKHDQRTKYKIIYYENSGNSCS